MKKKILLTIITFYFSLPQASKAGTISSSGREGDHTFQCAIVGTSEPTQLYRKIEITPELRGKTFVARIKLKNQDDSISHLIAENLVCVTAGRTRGNFPKLFSCSGTLRENRVIISVKSVNIADRESIPGINHILSVQTQHILTGAESNMILMADKCLSGGRVLLNESSR